MQAAAYFNPFGISYVLSGSALLGLAAYCFRTRDRTNRALGFVALSLAVYLLGLLPYFFLHPLPGQSWWLRLTFIGSVSLPWCFYYFTLSFLDRLDAHRRWLLLTGALDGLLIILAMTNWGYVTEPRRFFFGYFPQLGPSGQVFFLFFSALYGATLVLWHRAFRQTAWPIHRRRIGLLFLASCLALPGLIDFLPTLGFAVYPLGHLIALLAFGLIAYALFVYRVAQVEATLLLFLQRFSVIALLAFPWGLLSWMVFKFHTHLPFPLFVTLQVVIFIAIAPGIPHVERWLFHRQQKYRTAFEDILKNIAALQNPDTLMQSIQQALSTILKVPEVKIITRDRIHGKYVIYRKTGPCPEVPAPLASFMEWLHAHPGPFLRYDATMDPRYAPIRPLALSAFQAMNAQIFVPLPKGNFLAGLISIGDKAQGAILTARELDFLNQLQPLAAIALDNAYFYDHIQQLNQALLDVNQSLNARVKARTLALEAMLAEMKKLNEEQSRFFELASHNLGTPLTAVKVAFLIHKKQHPDMDPDLQEIMYKNLIRLEILIQNILLISLMENKRLQLKIQPVNPALLAEDAFTRVKALYPEMDVDWSLEAGPGSASVPADLMRLRSVFFNLLSNALKYSSAPARVRVSLQAAGADRLERYAEIQNGSLPSDRVYLEVGVHDQGEGIAAGDIGSIFHKFYQTDNTQKYKGYGLGLKLAKGIIEYHGGAIRVESVQGRGSSFYFLLPAAATGASGNPEKSQTPECAEGPFTYLPLPSALGRNRPES